LGDVDVAFSESAFAPGEIKIPHADEAFVEALAAHSVEILPETFAPGGESLRVVYAHGLEVSEREIGGAGEGAGNFGDGGEFAAGKDVGLDPIGAAAVGGDFLFGKGDGLQKHGAIGL